MWREPPKRKDVAAVDRFARAQVAHEPLLKLVHDGLDQLGQNWNSNRFLAEAGLNKENVESRLQEFKTKFKNQIKPGIMKSGSQRLPPLVKYREAYINNGEDGIRAQLMFALQGHCANYGFVQSDIVNQTRLADLRFPYEWYPATRAVQRKIHLHVGPTNSGKTYQALQRLEQSSTGIYAGPLRLLAHEVYRRLNANGKTCDLLTGDERVVAENKSAKMISCTVEMIPICQQVEVAVIDEIQMIGSDDRGWAWTQALMGVRAEEVHLCGEERAVPLIEELVAAMGEPLEIHRYERLNPLRAMSKSLNGKWSNLRKGDCVVIFSRLMIHTRRREIERETGKRVAVVYGGLPPEIRAQQAKLFNDLDNDYDYLVASDAVGMGLNLFVAKNLFLKMMTDVLQEHKACYF